MENKVVVAKTNDRARILTGSVNIQVWENGFMTSMEEEHNLVITVGKTNMTKLLGGAGGFAITQIAVGEDGTPPVVGNTTLTNMFKKALIGVTYPDAQSAMFSFEILNAEANGLTIREFGLFDSNNVLFARKDRATPIIKTSAIRLVGTWKITIN